MHGGIIGATYQVVQGDAEEVGEGNCTIQSGLHSPVLHIIDGLRLYANDLPKR